MLQKIHDLCADADVERRNRLIGDDELRLQGERARNADALPLAPGKLVRVAGHSGFIHTHGAQKFSHALPASIAAEAPADDLLMKNERLGNHVLDAVARVQRTERVLKDDLHVAAKTAQLGAVRFH